MMEDKFKQIQQIWQNQKLKDLSDIDVDKLMSNIFSKLVNFEKKQFRINMLKISLISIIILQLVFFYKDYIFESVVFLTGFSLFLLGSIVFMISYMKFQFRIGKLDLQKETISFLDEAINMLHNHIIFFKKYFWIFGLVLILALNIIYIDILKDMESFDKVLFHGGMTLFMVISLIGGLMIRFWRHKREYMPLINELKEIKEDYTQGERYE